MEKSSTVSNRVTYDREVPTSDTGGQYAEDFEPTHVLVTPKGVDIVMAINNRTDKLCYKVPRTGRDVISLYTEQEWLDNDAAIWRWERGRCYCAGAVLAPLHICPINTWWQHENTVLHIDNAGNIKRVMPDQTLRPVSAQLLLNRNCKQIPDRSSL